MRTCRKSAGVWVCLFSAAVLPTLGGQHGQDEGFGPLARLTSGEWRVRFPSGQGQTDHWAWGPGQHSLHGTTESSARDGESTSGVLRLLYRHPAREGLTYLGLSSRHRIGAGTARVDGDQVTIDFDFREPARPSRDLHLRWIFDEDDAYRSSLTESTDGVERPLAEWSFARPGEPPEAEPTASSGTPTPSKAWEPLASLIGASWSAPGGPRASLAWIPHADALHFRVSGDRGELAQDAWLFVDPASDGVRALVLSASGAVHEGEVTRLDQAGIELALVRHDGARRSVRVDREDGGLRLRVESTGDARAVLVDLALHRELALAGRLALPPGTGSRGVEVIATVERPDGEALTHWILFDEHGRFEHRFRGELVGLRVAAGIGGVVVRFEQAELPEPDRTRRLDLGVIDLRERLVRRPMTLRAADGRSGVARIGAWSGPPPPGVELGSRQFPERALGAAFEWLLLPGASSIHFLVERPATPGRGLDWRTGRQQLFGPFSADDVPRELVVE